MKNSIIVLILFFLTIAPMKGNSVCTVDNCAVNSESVIKIDDTSNSPILVISFEMMESGNYLPLFWVNSPRDSENNLYPYSVSLDGVYIGIIIPSKDGWHFASVNENNAISIKKGFHKYEFKATQDITPMVEHVCMYNDSSQVSSNSKYNDFINTISEFTEHNHQNQPFAIIADKTIWDAQDNPKYSFKCEERIDAFYTFKTKQYFNSGDIITISANNFIDRDNIYSIQIYYDINPRQFSKASVFSDKPSLEITVPTSGFYVIKSRPLYTGATTCNINILKKKGVLSELIAQYRNSPVALSGFGYYNDSDELKNYFTTNSTGDTELFIEELDYENINQSSYPKYIVKEYNDNFKKTSDYDWGSESRVFTSFNSKQLFISTNAVSSQQPSIKTDLYAGCSDFLRHPSITMITDPNYFINSENIMISDTTMHVYNCFAWAGGIYTEYVDPFELERTTSNNSGNGFIDDDFYFFDKYLSMERYPGCAKYTRSGVTEENAAINIWGLSYEDGCHYFTHASIRKNTDNNIHGYDWESKFGPYPRAFHPESVCFLSYGKIVGKYRLLSKPTTYCLEEAVAKGDAVIEYHSFTEEEKIIIDLNLNNISSENRLAFEKLYFSWIDECKKSIHSNIRLINSQSKNYRELINKLQEKPDLIYLLYDNIDIYPHVESMILDIMQPNVRKTILNSWLDQEHNEETFTYRPLKCFIIDYIKTQLNSKNNDSVSDNSICHSNSAEYDIDIVNGVIDLKIISELKKSVEIQIIDNFGQLKYSKSFRSDSNQLSIEAPGKGVYTLVVIIDGIVNSKKIIVK